jgi:mannose-6-phosphate isomerase-like protein (cupin superfamily)
METTDAAAKTDALRGAEKKEAFHQAAEAGIHSFKLEVPDIDAQGRKIHIKLAGTDSCRAAVQVLRNGGENNLHYHPNLDLIYMVLKGRVRFYGPQEKLLGDFGPNEGILLPENSRYWFGSVGDEEAWLLQIAGFPKGAKAIRRVDLDPPKGDVGGVWVGMSKEEREYMDRVVHGKV